MKVFTLLSDKGGSGYYRVSEPARAARARGVDATSDFELAVVASRDRHGLFTIEEITQDLDVLVIQRPLPQVHYAIAVAAKRQGIPLVIDLDDDFHSVHQSNVAKSATNHKVSPLENLRWLAKTLALCDVITVSTPALLKYCNYNRYARGVVVPNYVPEKILRIPARLPTGQVGWTGNVATHPEDLQEARGVLDLIDTRIAIVGYPYGVPEALQVNQNRVEWTFEWLPKIPEYWRALNASMDVGIVPLENSPFNVAKSWLKGIEYAALGKPFIASPLPEYKKLVEESGAGVLASGSREWAQAARDLLADGDVYRKAGRDWASHNTLELHVGEWISAWELALEMHQK